MKSVLLSKLRLKEVRKEAGLTQVELAKLWGKRQSFVSHAETADINRLRVSTVFGYLQMLGPVTVTVVEKEK